MFEELKPIAFQLMGTRKAHLEREKGGIYYHGERVAKTVVALRKIILPDDSSNDETLQIAALFHDIGKGIEPHAGYGSVLAREALKTYFDETTLENICNLISLHCARSPEDNNYSEYVKLLQDADMLDHFGTVDVWMNFWYSAYTERDLTKTAFFEDFDWESHCENNRKLLNYEISKRIFDEKVKYTNSFYSRLRVECMGDVFDIDNIAK